jgi:hypothetical protein
MVRANVMLLCHTNLALVPLDDTSKTCRMEKADKELRLGIGGGLQYSLCGQLIPQDAFAG